MTANEGQVDETVPIPRASDQASGDEREQREGMKKAISIGTWVLAGLAVILALTLVGLWSLYLFHGQIAEPGTKAAPIIWTPTPSATPAVTPTPTPTAAPPAPTVAPALMVGQYVQVVETGGYGLNLRAGPGTGHEIVRVASDGEVFLAVEGPVAADGFEWWKVQDPADATRTWWAVGDFLQPTSQGQ